MLPPHTLELWTYAKTQRREDLQSQAKYNELLEHTRRLTDQQKRMLESLRNPSQEDKNELLTFVKSPEFAPLCFDVSQFVNHVKRQNSFRQLVDSKRLSYRIEAIFKERNLPFDLNGPSGGAVVDVINRMSTRKRERRKQATIDARAVLLLKEINERLKDSNAKVVFITRDASIFELTKQTASQKSIVWDQMRDHLRGIESIFLDLVIRGNISYAETNDWIRESDRKLMLMEHSVTRTITQLRGSLRTPKPITALAALGKTVLNETILLWDQHINLKLSLAAKHIPWLAEQFLGLSNQDSHPEFAIFREEYRQLRNLLEFLSTDTYKNLASLDAESVWSEIEGDCLRLSFLNLVDNEAAARVSNALIETFQGKEGTTKTIMRSKRYLRMPSIQFISPIFQARLKALNPNTQAKDEYAFIHVIYEVAQNFSQPEDFLFLAFTLGMIEEWYVALRLIEHCRTLVQNWPPQRLTSLISPSELHYFAAVCKRRIAEMDSDAHRANQAYVDAYLEIDLVLQKGTDDPRYIKEAAAIATLYHESRSLWEDTLDLKQESELNWNATQIPSRPFVREMFNKALSLLDKKEDLRLRVSILNNLAYFEVIAEKPEYRRAEQYLTAIDNILKKPNESVSVIQHVILPNIEDTRLMLRGRKAWERADRRALQDCVTAMETLLRDNSLPRTEVTTYRTHLETLKKWLHNLASDASKMSLNEPQR